MADYISREAAIAFIREQSEEMQKVFENQGGESGFYADAYNDLAEDFYRVSAADVEPVRHARWNIRRPRRSALCLVCSACGRKVDNDTLGILLEVGKYGVVRHLYPYCHCGAKMVLEDENHADN